MTKSRCYYYLKLQINLIHIVYNTCFTDEANVLFFKEGIFDSQTRFKPHDPTIFHMVNYIGSTRNSTDLVAIFFSAHIFLTSEKWVSNMIGFN